MVSASDEVGAGVVGLCHPEKFFYFEGELVELVEYLADVIVGLKLFDCFFVFFNFILTNELSWFGLCGQIAKKVAFLSNKGHTKYFLGSWK